MIFQSELLMKQNLKWQVRELLYLVITANWRNGKYSSNYNAINFPFTATDIKSQLNDFKATIQESLEAVTELPHKVFYITSYGSQMM